MFVTQIIYNKKNMDILKHLILAFIQGATELLPISSSAHLLISSELLNFDATTYFLTTLHLGTTLALILYFSKVLFKDILTKTQMFLYLKILVSSIPAGIIGLLFQTFIEETLRAPIFLSISLILWGIAMILLERNNHETAEKKVEEVTWKESVIMGIAQSLALIPGTSRSGITTIAGMVLGLNKFTALQYSFLLGLPVLIGASAYELMKETNINSFGIEEILGIITAGIVGYLSILLLKRFKKKSWLTVFGIYRIILGGLLLLLL
jgi:undecaprenyl-diphosphatase